MMPMAFVVPSQNSPRDSHRRATCRETAVDGTVRPAQRWRLFGHVGALTPVGGAGARPREQYDVSVGIATEVKHGELRLAWTTRQPGVSSQSGQTDARSAIVLGATCFF